MTEQPHAKLHRLSSDADHIHDDLIPAATITYDLGSVAVRWLYTYTNFTDVANDVDWGRNFVRGPAAYYKVQREEYFQPLIPTNGIMWVFPGINGVQPYGGIQPDFPRNIRITNGDPFNQHTFTLDGVRSTGVAVSETWVVPAGALVNGFWPFGTITQVTDNDAIGGNFHVIQGSESLGLANSYIANADLYKFTKNGNDIPIGSINYNSLTNTFNEAGVNIAANDEWHVWYKI